MSYNLKFSFDGLTEDERYDVVKRLELIKNQMYPDLKIDCTVLHRENRVWVDQMIEDERLALDLFHLLSHVRVDKRYDDYYHTGVDSRVECSLDFCMTVPLE